MKKLFSNMWSFVWKSTISCHILAISFTSSNILTYSPYTSTLHTLHSLTYSIPNIWFKSLHIVCHISLNSYRQTAGHIKLTNVVDPSYLVIEPTTQFNQFFNCSSPNAATFLVIFEFDHIVSVFQRYRSKMVENCPNFWQPSPLTLAIFGSRTS